MAEELRESLCSSRAPGREAASVAGALQSVPELGLRIESLHEELKKQHEELKQRLQGLEESILQRRLPVCAEGDLNGEPCLTCHVADEDCKTNNDADSWMDDIELATTQKVAPVAGAELQRELFVPAEGVDMSAQESAIPDSAETESSKPPEAKARTTFSEHVRFHKMFTTASTKYQDNLCAKIAEHEMFDHASAILIIASSLLVGIEVQYKTDDNATVLDVLGYAFVSMFTAELLIRMRARGLQSYFRGIDFRWNLFDVFCVVSSYLEIIISSIQSDASGSFLLAFRTMRVIRIARIIRVIRFFGNLRIMVYTMLGAIGMLGWAALLLCMLLYMFSVCFAEAAKPVISGSQEIVHGDPDKVLEIAEDHFGDLYKSMLTLFESITGGVSWHDPLRVLKESGPLYVIMFVFYICVAALTILNVVTGLCCDYAIRYAVADRADVIKQQISQTDAIKKQFATIFKAVDEDDAGAVTSEELKQLLSEEEFQAYLLHLNISVDDALEFLGLLDSDGDGKVSFDEFVDGCMRVKGQAKTLDIMKLQKELVRVAEALDDVVRRFKGEK